MNTVTTENAEFRIYDDSEVLLRFSKKLTIKNSEDLKKTKHLIWAIKEANKNFEEAQDNFQKTVEAYSNNK
jgi:hypothetical protein